MKEFNLESGAVLKIGHVPFDTANSLKKVVLKELQTIHVVSDRQLMDLYKDYLCTAFASEDVEKCLWDCMQRCTYNSGGGDLKIDKNTFEPIELRGDFSIVQMEVAQECLAPFGKSLWLVLQRLLVMGATGIPK